MKAICPMCKNSYSHKIVKEVYFNFPYRRLEQTVYKHKDNKNFVLGLHISDDCTEWRKIISITAKEYWDRKLKRKK